MVYVVVEVVDYLVFVYRSRKYYNVNNTKGTIVASAYPGKRHKRVRYREHFVMYRSRRDHNVKGIIVTSAYPGKRHKRVRYREHTVVYRSRRDHSVDNTKRTIVTSAYPGKRHKRVRYNQKLLYLIHQYS